MYSQFVFESDEYSSMFNYLNDSKKDGYVEMDVCIKLESECLSRRNVTKKHDL